VGDSYKLRQVNNIANVLEQAFRDNEASREWFLCLIPHDLQQYPLQILHVVVFVPENCTSADLKTLSNGVIDRFVCHDDIASFGEGRNNRRDSRESLGIHNTSRRPKMFRNLPLGLYMAILCPVESRWPTRTNSIFSQRGDSLLFQDLIGVEIVKVVARQIRDQSTPSGRLNS